jgi:hypothetical protein
MNNNLEKIANFKSLECNTVNFTDEMSRKKILKEERKARGKKNEEERGRKRKKNSR